MKRAFLSLSDCLFSMFLPLFLPTFPLRYDYCSFFNLLENHLGIDFCLSRSSPWCSSQNKTCSQEPARGRGRCLRWSDWTVLSESHFFVAIMPHWLPVLSLWPSNTQVPLSTPSSPRPGENHHCDHLQWTHRQPWWGLWISPSQRKMSPAGTVPEASTSQ